MGCRGLGCRRRQDRAVDGDVDLNRPTGDLGDRRVDQGEVAGFDPLLGELARYEQLEGRRGVVAGADGREPGLVDRGGELRADDRGCLAPYVKRGCGAGRYGRSLSARGRKGRIEGVFGPKLPKFGQKLGRERELSTGQSTDVEKLKVINSRIHLLAASIDSAALWGEDEGKHQGSAIIDSGRHPSQRREKRAGGMGKAPQTAGPEGGYNRGRNSAATPPTS